MPITAAKPDIKASAPEKAKVAEKEEESKTVSKTKSKKEREAVAAESSSSSELSSSSGEISLDSDMDSDEIEAREEEFLHGLQSNSHGFVYSADLNTYRMNKKERTEARELEKQGQEKKKFLSSAAKRRNKKESGSTNVEKLKNKPMNMLLPKKIAKRNEKRDGKLKTLRKSDLKQIGHYKKNQKQKIESKKRMRIS